MSFTSFTRSYPSSGWIRGDAGDSSETLRKLQLAQEQVEILRQQLHDQSVKPPPSASGLADRDEVLAFTVTVQTRVLNIDIFSHGSFNSRYSFDMQVALSWNEILSALGPGMIDEASQYDLGRRFQEAVNRQHKHEAIRRVRIQLDKEVPSSVLAGYRQGQDEPRASFELDIVSSQSDFETAFLQLESLGLIEKGSKKRTPSDKGTYWILTRWGRARLTALRAVKTGTNRPPEKEDSVVKSIVEADPILGPNPKAD